MAATVHIPISDMEGALNEARVGKNVIVEGDGEAFHLERVAQKPTREWSAADLGVIHIERTDMRPLDEILADPAKEWSDVRMDDQWASDMAEVLAYNRAHDRDPWAE